MDKKSYSKMFLRKSVMELNAMKRVVYKVNAPMGATISPVRI